MALGIGFQLIGLIFKSIHHDPVLVVAVVAVVAVVEVVLVVDGVDGVSVGGATADLLSETVTTAPNAITAPIPKAAAVAAGMPATPADASLSAQAPGAKKLPAIKMARILRLLRLLAFTTGLVIGALGYERLWLAAF